MTNSNSIKSKIVIPEFITSKISDRKLNGDNYIKWRKIVEIYLIGHEKKCHLYSDLPSSEKMNGSEKASC